jgi:dipeptidyl aminopeptidase/acylaminoacyl peptidase
MRKTLTLLVAAIVVLSPAVLTAQLSPSVTDQGRVATGSARTELPPLIDREIFFGDPEITGAQLSPDGEFLTFLRTHAGQINIWVKRLDEPFEAARPLTADSARPVFSYNWSADGRWVFYSQDKGGDENFRIYRVDPTAGPAPGSTVPEAVDLTPYDAVQARIIALRYAVPHKILVGLNDRDARIHDVYWLHLDSGERELVYRNEINAVDFTADREGNLRLASRMDAAGGTEILRIDGEAPTVVYTCTRDESCGAIRYHADGRRVYMLTNRGDVDLIRLTLFDPETGAEELVEEDPEGEVDFASAYFTIEDVRLLATYYVADRLRIYFHDDGFRRDYERVRSQLGDGDIYFGSRTRDERLQMVSVTSDVDPGATYLYDRGTGEVTFQYRPRPNLPSEHLARMQPVRYPARDGLTIPAYLTVPQGLEPRNLPTVILPHGGPWARDVWGFDSFAQFLANRGYAVLQPNFRGSTGFGKAFLNAGNREWGTGAMQHDITDGVQWLIEQGLADPGRVAIMGGSYGGFATLAGVTFTPELYAAGVSIVGPSSILTLLESIPPYWEPMRQLFAVRVGDMGDPEDLEMLRSQSPLYSATQIQAPLLVVQGANDPRVKKHESDQIVVALRDLGREVEYLVAWDEGHGFANRENRLAMFAAIEQFLAQHLGGRYQADMPEPVAARLAAHRVQIDTLTLATPVVLDESAPAAAFDGLSVRPATVRYTQKVEMMGRTIEAEIVRSVTADEWEGRPVWTIVDLVESAMGTGADTTRVDRVTLLPLSRVMHQGGASIEVVLRPDSIVGRIQAGPQELPIRVGSHGDVLLDGAPLHVALATLPLQPGYDTTLRVFDLMSAGVKLHRLEVAAEETVSVAGGEFQAFRVDLTPADGSGATTLWIEAAAPNRVVRAEQAMPAQAGGGRSVTELTGRD